jgi:mRNA interferase HigB
MGVSPRSKQSSDIRQFHSVDVFPFWEQNLCVRIISKQTLVRFWERHPSAAQSLRAWYEIASVAKWKTPHDIKATFASASFVGQNRVVFNIKGNDYRLVVAVAYVLGAMYIKFVGTHKEYDAINVVNVEPKQ